MEIENLVEKAKAGNKEAYSELIKYIESDLYKIALSRLHNEADAQDALQEATINAYLNLHTLKKNSSFKAWITKILINECNHIHKKDKRKAEVLEKITIPSETSDSLDDNLSFNEMLEVLDETQRKIFSLHYDDGLSVKEIANMLNINENTVKTILRRGRIKIKNSYKQATIFMLILCLLIATSVIAISIISYIKSLFEVSSIGDNNDNVLTAIEHLDWFQETNMNYIEMDNGYKIKVEYLLMDEMNLYMVFDITSENDVSKITDIYFPDLKITNENGDIIYDETNILSESYCTKRSAKFIEVNENNMKVLVYMYTDSFPISKSLNISLSELSLLSNSFFGRKNFTNVSGNVNFHIELDEKFVNRNYIIYTSDKSEVEKAIITETGFYAIVKIERNNRPSEVKLIDENGNSYKCYATELNTDDDSISINYIIISDFHNSNCNKLTLVINKNRYELSRKYEGF